MTRLGIGIRMLAVLLLVVVLPFASLAFANSDARWRFEILALKASGRLDQIPWSDLITMLKPGSGFWLEPLVASPNPYSAINNPYNSAHDIKTGRALFRSQCQICHGPGARGATAPALVGREFTHGWSDWAVFQTIKYGVNGTPMAPHDLPPPDLWKLVAYVKDLSGTQVDAAAAQTKNSNLPPVAVSPDELRAARAGGTEWPTYY